MHRFAAEILSLPVDVAAPDHLANQLWSELQRRAVISKRSGTSLVSYEVRQDGDELGVVRVDGTSCNLIDSAESIRHAASLIADDAHRWVADHHPSLLLVHAGAVEWHGAAIVIPGRSHAGKSSLVAALLAAGARYLSDEFAPLDCDGNVHPYPRHLCLRDDQHGTRFVSAASLGAVTATEPVPVRTIVDASYVPGSTFSPDRLRGAVPLLTLVDNALVARSRPTHTLTIIARLTPKVTVLRSPRGDANETAALILHGLMNDSGATQ